MSERWYPRAVVYCLDVETFQDSNGDGVGDLRGLISRLDYLAGLGITCLWFNPIHPSPGKDDGYDVADFYNVHPSLGSLGDFVELIHQADNRGIRVMIDLVVNHTSDEHPWFKAASKDPKSKYRDWYVWSDTEPPDRQQGMVFPGEQKETWTYLDSAHAWYFHRFYDFEPDLNLANPEVRAEIKKIIAFWLKLGVSGFRMDAAPFVIELTEPGNPNSPKDFELLTEFRHHANWRRGDAVFLAEANVEPDGLPEYFGDTGGSGNRLHMLFDFMLNGQLMLALAREDAEPISEVLRNTPKLPAGAQWATFLRNHDEVDLSRLTAEQRSEVFEKFGPDPDMQLYDRGIRRRLAPMLGNDRRRIELAYSVQFTLRGTPVLRYGEEIGMGDDLSLPGRNSIRTPMQWTSGTNGGFSTAKRNKLVRPVINEDEYGCEKVNVTAQRHETNSLLSWFERMIRTLRECPEVGEGTCVVADIPVPRQVLVHRSDGPSGSMMFLHNLADEPVTVDLSGALSDGDEPLELFANEHYDSLEPPMDNLDLSGYGYRWFRLRRSTGGE